LPISRRRGTLEDRTWFVASRPSNSFRVDRWLSGGARAPQGSWQTRFGPSGVFVDKISIRGSPVSVAYNRTLFEKVWDDHVVCSPAGRPPLLYIDLHLVHEVTSPQAFDGLRTAGRKVRQPYRTVATVDHNIPTEPRGTPITDVTAARQIAALQVNCKEFGIRLFDIDSPEQGIVHVIG